MKDLSKYTSNLRTNNEGSIYLNIHQTYQQTIKDPSKYTLNLPTDNEGSI